MEPRASKGAVSGEVVAAVCVVSALAFGGAWVWHRPHVAPPRSIEALAFDASPTNRQEHRCRDARRIAEEILAESPGAVRVMVFATGDRSTGGEPIMRGSVARERQVKLVEHRDGDADRGRVLGEIDKLCAAVEPKSESPVFQTVGSVVKAMPATECQAPGTHCRVWIRTDGIETDDPVVSAALRSAVSVRAERYRPRIDNAGIDVVFCGLSERKLGKHGPRPPSLAVIEAAFRREFTHPERVRFEPTCAPDQGGQP